ncbi:hypothetical protein PMAYCL1PPCAC_19575, partial [Pristionchus mayeri]
MFEVRKSATESNNSNDMKLDGKQYHLQEQKSYDRSILSNVVRKCYLCDAKTTVVFGTPVNPTERSAFLDSLFVHERHKNRLELLRLSTQDAFFCIAHVVRKLGVPMNSLYSDLNNVRQTKHKHSEHS